MDRANKFLVDKKYPTWTQVNRVVDGGEPTLFKQYFSSWKEESTLTSSVASTSPSSHHIAEFDIKNLHHDKVRKLLKGGGSALGFSPDDGSGKKEIFRIENFELAPIDVKTEGMFFAGDSYVIRYTYASKGRQGFIVYFWQVCSMKTHH